MIKPFPKPRPVPLKLERFLWREKVTLCLAAECKRHKKFFSAVVFATDFQVEGEVGTAEIGRKLALTSDESHPMMFAGTQTKAVALAQEISNAVHELQPSPEKESHPIHWEKLLKLAIMRQKYWIANEITCARFAIPYDEFLKTGKASFPEDVHRETITEISRATLDCWLLVLGFSQSDPRIFRVSPSGSVEICENFAAIGSGYYIAEASLFQRSQSAENDLGTTIYNVYEAMKLGAIAPGVGDKFEIGIAEWDWYEQPNPLNRGEVKVSFLEPKYYDYLARKFKQYGPKPVSAVKLKPRLIKERWRAIMITPKGEHDEKVKGMIRRTKSAREREARKRAARQSVSQKSTDQQ